MDYVIKVDNLCKSYGFNKVLTNVSFTISANRIIGLLGENGIGKTTLLRLMADYIKPDSGKILINGQEVSRKTRDMVSFLLEPSNFYSFMKVKDAIQYYKDFFVDFNYEKAVLLSKEMNLDMKEPIKTLSKGSKERLCLLLNISRNVPIYLLDEPIAGFDPKFKKDFIKTILSNISDNAVLVISSHLLRDLQSVFDEIIILTKHEVITASSDDIRAKGKSVEDFYMEVIES